MNQRAIISLFLVLLVNLLLSCSNHPGSNTFTEHIISPTLATTNNNLVVQTTKIKFKTESGKDLFSLKQKDNGIKLVDSNEQELARIRENTPGIMKIKNASEQVLGYLIREKGQWKLENPSRNLGLYTLKRHNNIHYTLEDAANKTIYEIKIQKGSWEINTADKNLVYQVNIKDGKTSLINSSATAIFYTKSAISPIAFACFGFDVLTREQQAALAYAVNLTGGK
ncbi:hypothetical protein VB620_16590 [Nodularia harveyana UHCC-0300]|uniref:Lipoprotein n=1 Tax=Nodularia harveyana UHCC-0300 TaxID=2974287 RepID=A0ABU5UIA3_9CYAN|nr:hypothetical protein [Nodularia harveyana]MEA5582954.1 hypothetical protein [Nodularia harveyana UHCC-0300]